MRMKPEHAERLLQLFELTHLSPRSRLILARRIARHTWSERLQSHADFDAKLKNAAKNELAHIKHARNQASQLYRNILNDIGTWLCQNEVALIKKYGFEGICDVLEVNRMHRAEVRTKDKEGIISAIAFTLAFEDSAGVLSGRHPTEWKDGPLYQALRETVKAVRNNKMARI